MFLALWHVPELLLQLKQKPSIFIVFLPKTKARLHIQNYLPDDNDDAVKDVVRIPDVSKQAKSQQHEAHLQDEHTGEDNVTDL